MANVKDILEKSTLVIRHEIGEGKYKKLTIYTIKESATKEELYNAANAIADLLNIAVEGIYINSRTVLSESNG